MCARPGACRCCHKEEGMARNRDVTKRLKGIGIPIEVCVKYERMCGIPAGSRGSFAQRMRVSDAMIAALERGAEGVELSGEDWRLIRAEIKANGLARRG